MRLGELHPAVIHFPIVLPYALLLLEFISILKKSDEYRKASNILLYLAVVGTLVAAILGYILYTNEGDEGLLMQQHLWLGIASVVFISSACIAHLYQELKSYRIFLFLSVFTVSLAGHFGGTIAHESSEKPEYVKIDKLNKTADSLDILRNQAHEILQNYCVDCHGAKKSKGKLRLDKLEYALKGGKSGPALVLGNATKSELIRRIKLPKYDEEAMPTKGRRLAKSEIKILENWINKEQYIDNKIDELKVQHKALLDVYEKETIQPIVQSNLSDEQIVDLNIKVRTILAHSCYSCHNATKTKGGLRLDQKDFITKGGESGPVVIPGAPEKSEMIRRIKLPEGHEDAMPTKGKRLTNEEVEILSYWVKTGATWPSGPEKSLYRVAELVPRIPKIPTFKGVSHPVDRFVYQYFSSKRIPIRPLISDAQYIRRVYLDIIGLLPSPEQVNEFILDSNPQKRTALVDQLLTNNSAYAQHWLTFWNDLLRNDYAGPGYIDGGRSQIGHWLYNSLKANKSFDLLVKELINPSKESEGFIKGIIWRGTVNSSQSAPMQAAQNVSQVFMGLNLKCASCHDSFISDWKLEDAYGFANVFATKPLEIHKCDLPTGKMSSYRVLYPALGTINQNLSQPERLKQLAEVLVQKKNGRLYRTFVNRIWAQLMGRGLVEPVDAMDNAPWSQDLLDWLASDFASNGADIKQLIRLITTSKTYQMRTLGIKSQELLTNSTFTFRGPLRRRLSAEQFADGLSQVFQPLYTDSMIAKKSLPKEIFKEIPFARASLVKNDAFLTALGRPTRENVTTNRNVQGNLLQALELTNGVTFNRALFQGANHWVLKYPLSEQLVNVLYNKALGRNPTAKELQVALKYIGNKSSIEKVQDLAWAIFLLPEFQFIP